MIPRLSPRFFVGALLLSLAIGAFLRLDQITAQVLIEDEWHAVHQLIYSSPQRVLSSFGNADYSIPLTLYDWALADWIGLGELGLRLPMLVAGIATVVALPWAMRGRLDDRSVALFALLLAVSPFLVSYSRIARSYAVTLLGVYAAFWCLERATRGRGIRWPPATGYAVLCGLVVWTHVVTGPFLVAPLIAMWWSAGRGRGLPVRPLVLLTGLTGAAMAVAVLPPLLGDPQAVTGKAGVDRLTFQTIVGALHLWTGSDSRTVVLLALAFAAIGWSTVWRATPIARWALLGTALTCVALLVMQPWWVDRPLAFARYLLPAVPLILLFVAAGIVRAGDIALRMMRKDEAHPAWMLAGAAALLALWVLTSPYADLLQRPNSYEQHSYFQLDYRVQHNPIRVAFDTFPISAFWTGLASAPPETITVAVAPFRYATYQWPAPLWERASRQRVIPAFLWGTCEPWLAGEVPPDRRFRFRNAVHVRDEERLAMKGVDYLAYHKIAENPQPDCESWLRKRYGAPHYEDPTFVVWSVRRSAGTGMPH